MGNLVFKIKSFIFALTLFLLHVGAAKEIAINAMPLTIPQYPMRHFYFMRKIENIVGSKYGMLTIINDNLPNDGRRRQVEVLCDCGNKKVLRFEGIRSKKTTSCGCFGKIKSQEGERFGFLVITKDVLEYKKRGYRIVSAKCDCGTEKEYNFFSLKSGECTSCGCRFRKTACSDSFKGKNPTDLYWAGFIAADGCVTDNGVLAIKLQKGDYSQIDKLKDYLKSTHSVGTRKIDGQKGIQIINRDIVETLSEYGITPRKSLTYSPPGFCRSSIDFWRGMIDGDGCIFFKKKENGWKTLSIYLCGSLDSCTGFKEWVNTFTKSSNKIRSNRNIFYVTFYGFTAIDIIKRLYLYSSTEQTRLNRKHDYALNAIKEWYL